ncbi:MAG TPA: SPFH/Band 7/PHB domain protein, partial [Anaerolineaceae bacterium]|nr:SPFH/Band 7/PHB domain protein [Anaerolineaceae bacterium]
MNDGTTAFVVCIVAAIGLIVVAFVFSAIKIVAEYKRLVVFRLGRCVGAKGPGLVLLIPVIDKSVSVDLRE